MSVKMLNETAMQDFKQLTDLEKALTLSILGARKVDFTVTVNANVLGEPQLHKADHDATIDLETAMELAKAEADLVTEVAKLNGKGGLTLINDGQNGYALIGKNPVMRMVAKDLSADLKLRTLFGEDMVKRKVPLQLTNEEIISMINLER